MKFTSVTVEVKKSDIAGAYDIIELRRVYDTPKESGNVSLEERVIASGIIYQAIPATLALLLGKRFFSGLDS